MFAALTIRDFPLRALQRLQPEWRDRPAAVLVGEGRRALVAHVNAAASSVTIGSTVAQALSDCPALHLLERSAAAEREAVGVLLNAAWTLSPRVEAWPEGRCLIDLAGADSAALPARLENLRRRLAETGLPARLGVAANALVAQHASEAPGETLAWVHDARAFFRELPIERLAPTEAEWRLLRDLGVKTCGALTRFPRAELADRLGERGDRLWLKAAGEWSEPLTAAIPPSRHCAEMEWEEPIELLEPLLFVLRRFCERLADEVGQFGGGTARMTLALRLEGDRGLARDFDLPEPTARADLLFAALENHLASLHTDAPIVALMLEVFPARRSEQQEGFWNTGLKDAPMFYATLGRLAAVVGADKVGTPRRLDSHRPDALELVAPPAFVPERRELAAPGAFGPALRRLRPPANATVELTAAVPSYLMSSVARGDVHVLRPPFRASGDWWQPHAWTGEEWDVQVGTALLRLRHEPGGWFVEGLYD